MINNINKWFSNSLTNTNNLKEYFHPFIRLVNSNWNLNKYLAKVIDIREENKQTYSLILKPSKRWNSFKAGQFIQLTIEFNGSLVTRTFSISSSPQLFKSKGQIEITIQKQFKGKLTPHLQQFLKVNQYISISDAKGKFIDPKTSSSLLFIAAGSGITPINSLINDLLVSTNKQINLIYYASNDNHLFKDRLTQLEKQFNNLKINFINTSLNNRVNLNQIKRLCADFKSREVFICGPSAMIKTTESLLLNEAINPERIHYEYFGTTPVKDLQIENKGQVTFIRSAININTINNQNNTLLELAESSGLKPNTGCRMGVCHQCKCTKYQGVTYNTLTNIFSDSGAQEIQLCISVPVGDVVLDL